MDEWNWDFYGLKRIEVLEVGWMLLSASPHSMEIKPLDCRLRIDINVLYIILMMFYSKRPFIIEISQKTH